MKTRMLYVLVLVQSFVLLWGALRYREDVAKLSARSNRVTEARNQITAALEMYRVHFGRYPTESEGLDALLVAPTGQNETWRGPYLGPIDRSFFDLGLSYRNPNPSGYTLGLILNEK